MEREQLLKVDSNNIDGQATSVRGLNQMHNHICAFLIETSSIAISSFIYWNESRHSEIDHQITTNLIYLYAHCWGGAFRRWRPHFSSVLSRLWLGPRRPPEECYVKRIQGCRVRQPSMYIFLKYEIQVPEYLSNINDTNIMCQHQEKPTSMELNQSYILEPCGSMNALLPQK